MPNKLATKLRYVGQSTINPTTGGVAGVYVLNAIGLFDPDISGTGHQPRGFDELMTMYNHYQVVGGKVTVTFAHQNNATNVNQYVGIALKDGITPYTNPNDYLEGRNVVSTVLPANTTQPHTRTLSKTFSLRKFFGVTKPLSSNQWRGNESTNPNDGAYYHLFVAPVLGATDEPAITATWRMEFFTVFTEPKNPLQS